MLIIATTMSYAVIRQIEGYMHNLCVFSDFIQICGLTKSIIHITAREFITKDKINYVYRGSPFSYTYTN